MVKLKRRGPTTKEAAETAAHKMWGSRSARMQLEEALRGVSKERSDRASSPQDRVDAAKGLLAVIKDRSVLHVSKSFTAIERALLSPDTDRETRLGVARSVGSTAAEIARSVGSTAAEMPLGLGKQERADRLLGFLDAALTGVNANDQTRAAGVDGYIAFITGAYESRGSRGVVEPANIKRAWQALENFMTSTEPSPKEKEYLLDWTFTAVDNHRSFERDPRSVEDSATKSVGIHQTILAMKTDDANLLKLKAEVADRYPDMITSDSYWGADVGQNIIPFDIYRGNDIRIKFAQGTLEKALTGEGATKETKLAAVKGFGHIAGNSTQFGDCSQAAEMIIHASTDGNPEVKKQAVDALRGLIRKPWMSFEDVDGKIRLTDIGGRVVDALP